MKATNIAIIGAGVIGTRHLQGILKTENKISIYLIDPLEKALKFAKESLFQNQNLFNLPKIAFCSNIKEISVSLDIVIIATTASIRKKVILELLRHQSPKFVILEKVVFQKLSDFNEIEAIFSKMNIKSWVNCPLRLYPSFKNMKKYFKDIDFLKLNECLKSTFLNW